MVSISDIFFSFNVLMNTKLSEVTNKSSSLEDILIYNLLNRNSLNKTHWDYDFTWQTFG